MSAIRKLSPQLVGKIAAGEVVERPASAVKELVENSIDAGATNITVELRDGGIGYLRVSDNGCGIPAEQVRMAFERHATSKLSSEKDLYDMRTLGFRGEALASIAAVAKVVLTTRARDAAFGTRAQAEGGAFVDVREAASPVGTSVVVRELFYNTPVRLKFLKKPATEAALVSDYMLRLMLSRPDISFRFVNQGKTVYHSAGDGKVESALFTLYGREALSQMRRVSGNMNGLLLEGYVGVDELARGNRQQQSFFINGRYFRDAAISKALESGCEGRTMVGRFPMCALYLSLPYQQVDVNVHPNKLEVRFQNEQAVAEAVETIVREALGEQSLGARLLGADRADAPEADAPKVVVTKLAPDDLDRARGEKDIAVAPGAPDLSHLKPVVVPAPRERSTALRETVMPAAGAEAMLRHYARETSRMPPYEPPAPPLTEPSESSEQTTMPEALAPPRLIGVAFDTYWLFESGDRLLLVDQHAAHERMLYDELLARYSGDVVSQTLLSPQIARLTAREMALAEELAPALREAGFVIEPFDGASVAIRAVPTIFGANEPPRELFMEVLDALEGGRGEATGERVRRRLAQMACKRAIKGGDRLNEAEMLGFMQRMLQSDSMPTCPHGRPIVTEITRYALEKRFKRVQ